MLAPCCPLFLSGKYWVFFESWFAANRIPFWRENLQPLRCSVQTLFWDAARTGLLSSNHIEWNRSIARDEHYTSWGRYKRTMEEERKSFTGAYPLPPKSDDVSALVVDVGSNTTKMGYAGEESPKAVFPSVVGVLHGPSSSRERDAGRSPAAVGDAMDVEPKASSSTSTASSSSSSTRYFVGTNALHYRRDFMELQSPLTDGLGE